MIVETPSDIFQKITAQLRDKKPFVVYAKPAGKTLVGLFQQDSATHVLQDFAETGFVFAPFSGLRRLFIPNGESDVLTMPICEQPPQPEKDGKASVDFESKRAFEGLVARGVSEIKKGKFGKVVVSRKESVTLNDLNIVPMFRRLLATYPAAFRYLWFHPETDIWMGATPEQLLKATDNKFNTVALAGTQPFLGTEQVEWQEKEMTEQQFVTDFISESLTSSASGMTFSDPYTAKAGNLLHIKTDIQGTLNSDSGLAQVLEVLHPTPAVCGFPKAESREFILANEGYDREFYSGYLGELNKDFSIGKKATDLFVNLRCMKIKANIAELFMGCGITKDSIPENEYMETVNKSLTMKRIL